MKAKIFIKYKEGILDPQGAVTSNALKSINIKGINSMGIGKFIEIDFASNVTKENAKNITKESCRKLLVNPNTETFTFEIEE